MTLRPAVVILERSVARLLGYWLLAGFLLRVMGVRDGWAPLALVFYTTPWPVMAAGLLLLAGRARLRKHPHRSRRYLLLSSGALALWCSNSWHATSGSGGAADSPHFLRVVAWNTAHPKRTFAGVTKWLRQQDADIIAITECEPQHQSRQEEWRANFPEYEMVSMGNGLICLARGEFSIIERKKMFVGSFYGLYNVRIRGENYTILQADIYPWEPRQPPLDRLAEIATQHAQEKLIVIGDFNTPRESVHLDVFRVFLEHSFEVAGSGPPETWPSFAPALSLDHLWTSKAMPTRTCRLGWTLLSDHRPIIAEFGGSSPQLDRAALFRNRVR